jgi:hypothetical protein
VLSHIRRRNLGRKKKCGCSSRQNEVVAVKRRRRMKADIAAKVSREARKEGRARVNQL